MKIVEKNIFFGYIKDHHNNIREVLKNTSQLDTNY